MRPDAVGASANAPTLSEGIAGRDDSGLLFLFRPQTCVKKEFSTYFPQVLQIVFSSINVGICLDPLTGRG